MKKRQRRIAAGETTTETMEAPTFATWLRFRVTSSRRRIGVAHRRPATSLSLSLPLPLPLLLASFALQQLVGSASAVGYSYSRFEGPVVGPEREVAGGDFVAQPEYSFAYGVEDGESRVLQNRKETRHGDEVRGVYSVVDPDGTLRVVKYTADDAHGFQAEVITNGVAMLHGHGHGHGQGGAPAAVEQHVEHVEHENEVDSGQKGKGQYKVHEDYDEGKKNDGEKEEEEEDGDEEGDHAEYEGSSEEGYDDHDGHRQPARSSSEQEEEEEEDY